MKAFTSVYGRTPIQCTQHGQRSYEKGRMDMVQSRIVIRPVCKDDVHDYGSLEIRRMGVFGNDNIKVDF